MHHADNFDTGVDAGSHDTALKRAEPGRPGRGRVRSLAPRGLAGLLAALVALPLQAQAQTASTDATLSGLEILGAPDGETIALIPVFDAATGAYTAMVANRIDAVTLTATKNDNTATVAITRDDNTNTPDEAVLSLTVGANTLTVTSADTTTTQTYTSTVARAAAPPAPTDCPADTAWCATLGVCFADVSPNNFIKTEIWGYRRDASYGDLSPVTFSHGGTSYTDAFLYRLNSTAGGITVGDQLNLGPVGVGGFNSFWTQAQRFTTGSNEAGYTLSAIDVLVHEFKSASSPRVSIYTVTSGNPGTSLYVLTNPATLVDGAINTFTAPANATLAKDTDYFVVFDETGTGSSAQYVLNPTFSNAEDAGKASGWGIANNSRERTSNNGPWENIPGKLKIAVKGTATPFVTATLEAFYAVERSGGILHHRIDVKLSKPVWLTHRDMRDHAFDVTNGTIVKAKRIHTTRLSYGGQRRTFSNHWRLEIRPTDVDNAVTVALKGVACGQQGGMCSREGVSVINTPSLTVGQDGSGPVTLSIADASANENDGQISFAITLSRASPNRIDIRFRTISGGTATEGVEYGPIDRPDRVIPPETTTWEVSMKHRWLGPWRASFDSCTNASEPEAESRAAAGALAVACEAAPHEHVRPGAHGDPAGDAALSLKGSDAEANRDAVIGIIRLRQVRQRHRHRHTRLGHCRALVEPVEPAVNDGQPAVDAGQPASDGVEAHGMNRQPLRVLHDVLLVRGGQSSVVANLETVLTDGRRVPADAGAVRVDVGAILPDAGAVRLDDGAVLPDDGAVRFPMVISAAFVLISAAFSRVRRSTSMIPSACAMVASPIGPICARFASISAAFVLISAAFSRVRRSTSMIPSACAMVASPIGPICARFASISAAFVLISAAFSRVRRSTSMIPSACAMVASPIGPICARFASISAVLLKISSPAFLSCSSNVSFTVTRAKRVASSTPGKS